MDIFPSHPHSSKNVWLQNIPSRGPQVNSTCYYDMLLHCSRIVGTFEWFFIPTFSALSGNACINFLVFLNFLFIYFIPAARGLHCCVQASSSCGERGRL